MPEIVLLLTKHAKEKMAVHGISKEQVKQAIVRGATVKQTEGYLASYTYLKIAYKKVRDDVYKIKTVFVG